MAAQVVPSLQFFIGKLDIHSLFWPKILHCLKKCTALSKIPEICYPFSKVLICACLEHETASSDSELQKAALS